MRRLAVPLAAVLISAALVPLGTPLRVAAAPLYAVQDLGTLPGDTGSAAMGINEFGQVVGGSMGPSGSRAFLYTDGVGMLELPPLPGQTASRARRVNASGQVIGGSGIESGTSPIHAVRWTDRVPQDLGTLGTGLFSDGYGIDRFGRSVGYSYTDGGGILGVHAFLHDASGLVDLTPATDTAYAEDINDSGQVTGWKNGRAFRWTNGVFEDLGVPAGLAQSFGFAINNRGQVAGHAVSASGNEERIFRFTDGVGLQDLGGVGEHNIVFGMNNLGQIVGQGQPAPGLRQAFLYTDETGLISLNALIDQTLGWVLLGAGGINDSGQIAAWGFNNLTQQSHAVRLNPTGTLLAPTAPTGLTAGAVDSSWIDLAWADTSGTESGFRIERRVAGGTFSLVATTAANATTYLDTELAAATTYEYRLQAFNIAGASAYSNTAAATTPALDVTAPTLAIASPTDGATVSGTVTIIAAAADDVRLSILELAVDGVHLCSTSATALSCRWNTRKVAIGAHRIQASATDTSGNHATVEIHVFVAGRK